MICNYDIEAIISNGNSVTVHARFCYGDYETVIEPVTQIEESIYVRKGILAEKVVLFFERYPVTDEEIRDKLLSELDKVRGDRNVLQ